MTSQSGIVRHERDTSLVSNVIEGADPIRAEKAASCVASPSTMTESSVASGFQR